MNNRLILAAACCALLGIASGALADDHGGRGRDDPPGLDDNPGRGKGPKPKLTTTILEFQTMAGVNGTFLGGVNPIRGVNGGGLPWVLKGAKGELKDNGKLEVEVEGLVVPQIELACGDNCNPAPFFKAIVSCLTVDATGHMVIDNVDTENGAEVMIGDPKAGNAKIEAMLDLPEPCMAPIVLVTSPTGAWFAVTGVGVVP